ncbi:MAG: endonuclease III [Synergistaceae bacterium]|nr:endonuclease III [Synergistaceae bacterium]
MNKEKIFFILDELENIYHNETQPPELGHEEPLDGLILTVLSQNTNDRNRDTAYRRMKAVYPTLESVIEAGATKLENVIKSAGLGHTKAGRIINILNIVHEDFGEYSLKPLLEKDSGEIRNYLKALPGVGAKTVACVMLFDMKIPAFPVDTHVTRVSKRVGVASLKDSPEEISQFYESVVPIARCLGGHVNIIAHGRDICHAKKPECEKCVLASQCNFYKN